MANKKEEKQPFNFGKYVAVNKLPLLVGDYRVSMMRKLKKHFLEQFYDCVAQEKEYCTKNNVAPFMDKLNYNAVCDLLQQTKTFFEIEALARYTFDDNEIPTYERVKERAKLIEFAFGVKLKD